MADFNYGAEVVHPEDPYKEWPNEGEFTALLDGDLLPYIVGYTTDEEDYVSSFNEVNRKIAAGDATSTLDLYLQTKGFQNCRKKLDSMLNDWIESAGCDSAIVYLTDSAENFRNDIAFTKEYKGQRSDDKPPFFYEMRMYMIAKHKALVSQGCEADDLMSIEMWDRHRSFEGELYGEQHKTFCDACIVSKDKDLMMVPGWHYNPDVGEREWVDLLGSLKPKWKEKEKKAYEFYPLVHGSPTHPEMVKSLGLSPDRFASGAKKGQVKTKRVHVGMEVTQNIVGLKGGGLMFFYAQILMGDTSDNYPGLKRCGPARTYEILQNCKSEEELWDTVVEEYRDKLTGGTSEPIYWDTWRGETILVTAKQVAVEQGQLAWMQTEKGEIWCPAES